MKPMTIGKLSAQTGVSIETIRYYEINGILPAPDRLPSGYRVYGADTAKRLLFIREAQTLGFTLVEIQDLLSLTDDPDADCAQVNARAEQKLEEITNKIKRLQKMQKSLKRLAEYCPADEQPLSECSIINHLYGAEEQTAANKQGTKKKEADHDA